MADSGVVTDHRCRTAIAAVDDEEFFGNIFRLGLVRHHGIDARQRRRLFLQTLDETAHLPGGAANFNFNAARIIAHPTGQLKLSGQTPDKGPEADALNDAADANALANFAVRHVIAAR